MLGLDDREQLSESSVLGWRIQNGAANAGGYQFTGSGWAIERKVQPVVLAVYAGMARAIAEHGSFDERTREAIALAVGNVDGCDYCQAAHTLSATKAGFDSAQTVAIRAGRVDFDNKLAALVTVVREAAGEVGDVSDATWENAVEAGWTAQQLSEAFAHLAVNLFTNYFTHYARTELDLPAAPPLEPS